ncbi:response regulator transcription factor [Clostridiaceae bacterium M8S5]|nr:response regulator transcription factor [Clostridiaceae bacterium M8S5]
MQEKIYIADDERNIRDPMAAFLRSSGFVVVEFETGDALLKHFLLEPADLVILDIMMPGTDGLALCTKIREKSNVPIIIVSARDSEVDRITGITLGSDDYLTKPFSPVELVARVRAIFRRINFTKKSNEIIELSYGNLKLNINSRNTWCDNKALDLTPTEFVLTKYLLENKEIALSRKELLQNVWNYDFDVDTRSTDYAVKRLRKKFEIAGVNLIIESVWGFGFKLTKGGT